MEVTDVESGWEIQGQGCCFKKSEERPWETRPKRLRIERRTRMISRSFGMSVVLVLSKWIITPL